MKGRALIIQEDGKVLPSAYAKGSKQKAWKQQGLQNLAPMASFSFSFSGDDIEDDSAIGTTQNAQGPPASSASNLQALQAQPARGASFVTPAAVAAAAPAASAFPVQGKPQLPPQRHDLGEMLSKLPSKIVFGLLDVALDSRAESASPVGDDSGTSPLRKEPCLLRLPRRELWDVKVQLMAEEEAEDDEAGNTHELAPGLGEHDVKTGIYEGGFKSWESSVDLVKVLLQPPSTTPTPALTSVAGAVLSQDGPAHVIEVNVYGCFRSYSYPVLPFHTRPILINMLAWLWHSFTISGPLSMGVCSRRLGGKLHSLQPGPPAVHHCRRLQS